MNDHTPDAQFDQRLRSALGSAKKPDFDAWRARHAESLAYLNPVVSEFQRRRRRLLMRTAKAILAAAACSCVIWFFILERESFAFAEAIKKIDDATTITWTTTVYERRTSTDAKRSWLVASRSEWAYRHPGLYRITKFDGQGKPRWVHIADSRSGQSLDFDLQEKKVAKGPVQYQVYDPLGEGPFAWVAKLLKTTPLEFVGQRTVKNKTVNVFRTRSQSTQRTGDYWIDAESKELVGYTDPGADLFDPQTDPDRDHPAEKSPWSGQMLGCITADIGFDAKLDADLFGLMPPLGYEIVKESPLPLLTEAEIIEWLGAMARVNKGIFPAGLWSRPGYEPTSRSEIVHKKRGDRTELEQKMYDLGVKYAHSGDHGEPIARFTKENAVEGSFRYVGVGVKLGSADRIVCWYKSKSTGTYRAVFGDLTVKEVKPEDLPLQVDR